MSTIDTATTLGDLVTRQHRLARELERRGLDYCCGGRQTLEEACRAADLDPAVVAEELAAAVGEDDDEAPWATMGVVELVDHIVETHHRFLWDELPRLEALAEKVADVHGERHPELADVYRLVMALRLELEPHLTREESILFPHIRDLVTTGATSFHCGSLANPISVMLVDHDRAAELLGRLRAVTGGYGVPGDACASYRACYEGLAEVEADIHLHVHKENNLLFPAVVRLEDELRSR